MKYKPTWNPYQICQKIYHLSKLTRDLSSAKNVKMGE